MRHEQLKQKETFDVVDRAGVEQAAVRPEFSVPDVPAAVGLMIVASYVLIIGLFALTIASAGNALFMIAIDLVFLAAFFSVPVIFLRQEGDTARRPRFSQFLARGMQTYTGHVSGAGALAQMLVVPALLAFGVLAIGIIAQVA